MNKLQKLLLKCQYCNKTTGDVDYLEHTTEGSKTLTKSLICAKCLEAHWIVSKSSKEEDQSNGYRF